MTDAVLEPPPIACTLGAGDLPARLAQVAALNARWLRDHRRDDLVLHMTYASDAADEVREMVAKERECCAFLDFELTEDADGVQLTITAPERARTAAELAFAPFTAKTATGAASSCC